MADRPVTRRRAVLAAGGLALTALAGCSTGSDGGDGGATTTMDGGTTTSPLPDAGPVSLRPVATGLDAPLDLADAPDSALRYVADQTGLVSTAGPDGDVAPFLDLRDRVVTGGEMGLLGLALHPDYEENRKLYVRYSSPRLAGTPASFSHTFVLSEFRATEDGRRADPDSERILLRIPEPQGNHNSGAVAFGPDGYLYVGVGDGGAAGDVGTGHADDWYRGNPGGNGQDVTDNLLGSILRIDVDGTEADRPYGIPDDNPLVGEVGLDEHWAWGLRNPWRMSFDGEDLYVGDVGQNAYEEVDLVRRGGNYGWNVREGTHCYEADGCPDATPPSVRGGEPLLSPVVEYPHEGGAVSGVSVITGNVYRGQALPGLRGRFVFGDLRATGRLFVATPRSEGLWPVQPLPVADDDAGKLSRIFSFQRHGGEMYVLGSGDGGGGHRLRPAP